MSTTGGVHWTQWLSYRKNNFTVPMFEREKIPKVEILSQDCRKKNEDNGCTWTVYIIFRCNLWSASMVAIDGKDPRRRSSEEITSERYYC